MDYIRISREKEEVWVKYILDKNNMIQIINKDFRDCKIVDVNFSKQLDLKVISPVENIMKSDHNNINSKTYNVELIAPTVNKLNPLVKVFTQEYVIKNKCWKEELKWLKKRFVRKNRK